MGRSRETVPRSPPDYLVVTGEKGASKGYKEKVSLFPVSA